MPAHAPWRQAKDIRLRSRSTRRAARGRRKGGRDDLRESGGNQLTSIPIRVDAVLELGLD